MGVTIVTGTEQGTCLCGSTGGTPGEKRRARRVLVVDEHPIMRQGLRCIVENEDDLTVCGEAETVRAAHRSR